MVMSRVREQTPLIQNRILIDLQLGRFQVNRRKGSENCLANWRKHIADTGPGGRERSLAGTRG